MRRPREVGLRRDPAEDGRSREVARFRDPEGTGRIVANGTKETVLQNAVGFLDTFRDDTWDELGILILRRRAFSGSPWQSCAALFRQLSDVT